MNMANLYQIHRHGLIRTCDLKAYAINQLLKRLSQRIEGLDLQGRAHQLHLPSEAEREAFLVMSDRIAAIRGMQPREG
jgi:hypothetical protein